MRHPGWDEEVRLRLEAVYDKFTERVFALLAQGRGRGHEAVEAATETVRAGLAAAGELSAVQGEAFKRYLRRDLRHLADEAQRLGRAAQHRLHPQRLRDGSLAALAEGLQAGGAMLQSWAQRANEAVIYEAGEITSAGTLTCLNCGRVIHLDRSAHVPPCPDCLAARFRKSY